jgi:phosphate transport system protein
MRSIYMAELEELNNKLIRLGMLCENSLAQAGQALIHSDMALADEVIARRSQINRKEREIESLCVRLLLTQQPVAGDLRMISAALKMVTDMERIGDQSTDIADTIKVANITHLPEGLEFQEMSEAVIHMVTKSMDAFVRQDEVVARKIIRYDDVVDGYFDSIKKKLADLLRETGASPTEILDLLMIAKYFERTGDHAVNIANWVIFSVTGENIGVQKQ